MEALAVLYFIKTKIVATDVNLHFSWGCADYNKMPAAFCAIASCV